MHIPDWDEAFLSDYDPEAVADRLADSGARGVMVYAKSHLGLCYWPTRLGREHGVVAGRDVFGRSVKRLGERGVGVCAYYSVVFDNWAADTHPDWRQVNLAGIDLWPFMRYGVCCLNNPEYRQYERDLFTELLATTTGYDTVFVDMVFWPVICGCAHCRQRYLTEAGRDIPDRVDWSSAAWCGFQEARERWADQMAEELAGIARERRPELSFTHNFAPAWMGGWEYGQSIDSARHDDFVAGDLYGDRIEQLVVSKAMAHLTERTDIPELMTSMSPDLHDHVRRKSTAQLKAQALAATSVSAAFLLIDAIDPRGGLDDALYDRLPEALGAPGPYEPYLGGRPVEDVLVYLAVDSQVSFADNGRPATDFVAPMTRAPHLAAVRGAASALQAAHIPFGVVTRQALPRVEPHQVLVVPNAERLSDEETSGLRRHLQAGGRLYASRDSSTASSSRGQLGDLALADALGVSRSGRERGPAFLRPVEPWLIQAVSPHRLVSVPAQAAAGRAGLPLVTLSGQGRALAALTLPYGHPSPGSAADRQWASIHSSPPWEDRADPVVVESRWEGGHAIYSCADIEADPAEDTRALFLALVGHLLGRPSFEVEAHPCVWASAWEQEDPGRTVLSLLNYPTELPPVPVPARFRLRPPPGRPWAGTAFTVPTSAGLRVRIGPDGWLEGEVTVVADLCLVVADWEDAGSGR